MAERKRRRPPPAYKYGADWHNVGAPLPAWLVADLRRYHDVDREQRTKSFPLILAGPRLLSDGSAMGLVEQLRAAAMPAELED